MQTIKSKPKYFQADRSLKRVELDVYDWLDREYGCTCFAAEMIINEQYRVLLDFQFGKSDSETLAAQTLFQMGMTKQANKGLRLICDDARATLTVRYV